MLHLRTLRELGYSGMVAFAAIFFAILACQYYFLSTNEADHSLMINGLAYLVVIICILAILSFVFLYQKFRRFYSSYGELIQSEVDAKSMASQVSKLYDELGKSYQDLESVNHIPEEYYTLFKILKNGHIFSFTEKLKDILLLEEDHVPENFFDWLKDQSYDEGFIKQVHEITSKNESWNGEIKTSNSEGDFVWLELVIQPIPSRDQNDHYLLVMGRDISELNEAKQRSREINRELVDKRVKEQQYRSTLILEGQEEERKRIAQEIHDGIGQMLTGLKLNMEGIVSSSSPLMRQRMSDSRHLIKSIIKEVRRVSFNLAPSSLVDFGIVPALKKISQETTNLTDTQVSFENETGFINRLDPTTETNLYRVVQEAVNNGIKYAKAEEIKIILNHTINQLTIEVVDNGKGFDMKKLEKVGHFGASGNGLFNMKERAAYVNASFDIHTSIGKGTSVKIKLPLT